MEQIKKGEYNQIRPFFEGWEETMIYSYLQNRMGQGWIDNKETPQAGQIIVGNFCFLAGKPDMGLIKNIPSDYPDDFIILTPRSKDWGEYIQQAYPGKYTRSTRYAIKKESDIFDVAKLESYVKHLPEGYTCKPIDKTIYEAVQKESWSKDFCSNYPTYDIYQKNGLGYVIMAGDEIVAGASSYTSYEEGLEIEVDTRPDYRRKGLALSCAAKLILECLERGLYPSWDAANQESVALAEKLGYHLDHAYEVYIIQLDAK